MKGKTLRKFLAALILVSFTLGSGVSFRAYAAADGTAAAVSAITYWARFYGLPVGYMLAVARCESGLNQYAYNAYSGASGLYQFMPSTFYSYRRILNMDPNDRSRIEYRDYWNMGAASHVASYMFSIGEGHQWSCAAMV